MRAFLLVALLTSSVASAQSLSEDAPPASVLVLTNTQAEAIGSSDVLERGGTAAFDIREEPVALRGPHGRAAWEGAKTGAIVGLVVGGAVLVAATLYEASGGCDDDFLCTGWKAGAASIVPIALTGAGIGAGVGWVGSHLQPGLYEDE